MCMSSPKMPPTPLPQGFNSAAYFAANPDVAADSRGISAERHYRLFGQAEGRPTGIPGSEPFRMPSFSMPAMPAFPAFPEIPRYEPPPAPPTPAEPPKPQHARAPERSPERADSDKRSFPGTGQRGRGRPRAGGSLLTPLMDQVSTLLGNLTQVSNTGGSQ